MGMYETFQRFANEETMSAYKLDKFAVDHPSGQERVFDLNDMVETSPYREVQDSPESLRTFLMVQAKLGGFVLPVKEALDRWPESDTSEPARYAHTMIYLRQPNLKKALATAAAPISQQQRRELKRLTVTDRNDQPHAGEKTAGYRADE
jgi:predicted Zn-dependent protease